MSNEKVNEVETWSKNIMAFLKVVEKKHPEMWKGMEEILKEKTK